MAIEGLTARLYLDHNLHARLAPDLRQRGFDVISAQEAGMASASDEEQLAFATTEKRVVLTFDIADFATLAGVWHGAGRHHAGIVVSPEIRGSAYPILLRRVLRMLNEVTADELADTLRFLSEFAAG